MTNLKKLTKEILSFRDARDWKQFHNPKDLAISIVLEAGELMEHFQWKTAEQMKRHVRRHKEDIADEVADVLIYLIEMGDLLKIDIVAAAHHKLKKAALKYPVAEVIGKNDVHKSEKHMTLKKVSH
ncbi:nucleotide pyrophosphohydrolase [Candidatus Woesebacteria bacterium]|nr:nucleotide pyrophosphohydrolase [Candidatus Woesebacteria bacterium]